VKKRLLQATFTTLVMMTPGLALDNRRGQTSDEGAPTVTVPAYASAPKQLARFWSASTKAPLVVDLHQWSTDQSGFNGDDVRFDLEVRKLGWNFVRPALAGKNNSPHACCSAEVLDGISASIQFAESQGKVDRSAIYIVGVSGGGYTTLCAYMSGKVHARAMIAWASITDLAVWHAQHTADQYGKDVESCTGSSAGKLNLPECSKRSPISLGNGQPDTPVYIFAGIHDGFTGSVPITHSVRLFNRLADLYGLPSQKIDDATLIEMLDRRVGPDSTKGKKIGGRLIHLERVAGAAHLTVFEGGHEMLTRATVPILVGDYDAIRSAKTPSGSGGR
jgi:poly(3-hydroxybutyrate) depolymerase